MVGRAQGFKAHSVDPLRERRPAVGFCGSGLDGKGDLLGHRYVIAVVQHEVTGVHDRLISCQVEISRSPLISGVLTLKSVDTSHGLTDGCTTRFSAFRNQHRVVEFETEDPAIEGEMTISCVLPNGEGGTSLTGLHENLPSGVSSADNELGLEQVT
jgi:hypothetical protein